MSLMAAWSPICEFGFLAEPVRSGQIATRAILAMLLRGEKIGRLGWLQQKSVVEFTDRGRILRRYRVIQ